MLLQEEMPAVSGTAKSSAVYLVFSRWVLFLLAMTIVLPWLVIAFLLVSRNASSGKTKSSTAVDLAGRADAASPQADRGRNGESANSTVATISPPPQVWTPGKKGPWGQIDSMLFDIDVPDEFVFVPPANQPPIRWCFPGYSKEKVLATLRSVGVPGDEVKKLETGGKWSSDDGVTAIEP